MIGQQIGQYRITAKIGEGGMGAVFEAVDETIGKRVAIKVLHKEHAKNQQIASRFVNEARAINVVDHQGLVQVSAFGQLPDGTAYIVMELLKGETLNARMKAAGRMPVMDALRLIKQLASALAAAHAKEIIHRDLKPDNIMIVKDSEMPGGERTKLLDFGIAKLKQEYQGGGDQVMTRAGVMMGTPLYMSPEQCRNASDVDDKADVYSLGVIFYRMLAGKPPFQAPGTGELMAMHIYVQPPQIREIDPTLPEALAQLVHRMLGKKREERPSMAQVAAELDRIGVSASQMVAPIKIPQQQPLPAYVNDGATVLSDPAGALAPRPAERLASQNAEQIAAKSGQQPVAAKPPARGPRVLIGVVLGLLGLAVPALIALRAERAKQTPPKPPAVQPSDNDPSKTPKPTEAKIIRWHIESEPTGAEIYQLDTGELLGKTPFRAEQPARKGTVELELRKEGYQPLKLTVDGDKDAEPASQQLIAAEPEAKPTHKRDRSKHGKK